MSYYLLLDDNRTITQVANLEDNLVVDKEVYFKHDWIVVKNFAEFATVIESKGMPYLISFDHDLGERRNGTHCAKWLTKHCDKLDCDLPDFMIHSMNSVGAKEILSWLNSWKKAKSL